MDHRDWLGDTLEAIGREKAGIFRAGTAGRARLAGDAVIVFTKSSSAYRREAGGRRARFLLGRARGRVELSRARGFAARRCRLRRSAARSSIGMHPPRLPPWSRSVWEIALNDEAASKALRGREARRPLPVGARASGMDSGRRPQRACGPRVCRSSRCAPVVRHAPSRWCGILGDKDSEAISRLHAAVHRSLDRLHGARAARPAGRGAGAADEAGRYAACSLQSRPRRALRLPRATRRAGRSRRGVRRRSISSGSAHAVASDILSAALCVVTPRLIPDRRSQWWMLA